MPDHLKDAQNTEEFQKYLTTFVKTKEKQHRRKIIKEVMTAFTLMMAG